MKRVFFACLLALACTAEAGSDEVGRGAAHVAATCNGCHPGPQLDAVVRRRVADRDAHQALDAFLGGHHVADAALRSEVIAHLLARLDAAAEGE